MGAWVEIKEDAILNRVRIVAPYIGAWIEIASVTHLAEKTGFSNEDVEKIKNTLVTLFENDASAACPEGSIEVHKVCWWKHKSKIGQYASAKVHRLLEVNRNIDEPKTINDYNILVNELDSLNVVIIDGL
ncbi:type I CRISPR-associated protein Cas7 [Bacillus cereus]|nr:type I CRISPR-associated protein Cas7 [Bacillus cereus]MRB42087.1 CRISPR-associated protein Csd2 [Bacillus thuringiensis]MRB83822.1 CRISPR-associated protein Csd2 [Bacillus thuringiensis]PEV62842.1 CRISPR-associated protein Csd2 [Bacillus thuringiensis]PGB57663.1 CRISPR-associated protein Csd2 [Bacillus anthracis]